MILNLRLNRKKVLILLVKTIYKIAKKHFLSIKRGFRTIINKNNTINS